MEQVSGLLYRTFELCENYGEIAGFWFDVWWDKLDANWRLGELYDMIHSLQPSSLIDNNYHVTPFSWRGFPDF
ncbi:MAG: hypothetical protein RMI79_00625 [Nitrososphaerota archaeon]|nr:hypothetical protein [Nitrososphaerota archaeon]